jgi:AmpD protein
MTPFSGWLEGVTAIHSPNFNSRPENMPINMIVIHGISLPPAKFGGSYIEQFFTNTLDCSLHPYFETVREKRVSAHFLIKRTGKIIQFVSVWDRAWHAGASSFAGQANCNDFSIGIELEGTDDIPYTSAQYRELAGLIRKLRILFPKITSNRIVGHSDIAPGRKMDPGAAFNWVLLRQNLKGP